MPFLNPHLANARSLLPKTDKLEATLQMNEVNLAFIRETWLNENVDDDAVQLNSVAFPWYDVIDILELGVEYVPI